MSAADGRVPPASMPVGVPANGFPDDRPPWPAVLAALLIIFLFALLAAQAAFFIEARKPDAWRTTSQIEFRDPNLLPETVALTLASPSLWAPVAESEGISEEEFLKAYEPTINAGTQIVDISYIDEDPERGRRIVNAISAGYVAAFQADEALNVELLEEYLESLRVIEGDLVVILESPEDLSLEEQISGGNELLGIRRQVTAVLLRIDLRGQPEELGKNIEPRIITPGFTPVEPVEPQPAKSALFGFVAGGLVGALVIYLIGHSTAQRPDQTASAAVPAVSEGSRLEANPVGRFAKRTIDVVVSSSLLAVLSPLIVLIGIVVLIDSRGGALFRQIRVGKDEREFEILKFRTMYHDNDPSEHVAFVTALLTEDKPDAEHDGVFKLDDDRVTRVGKHLRRFSLDELPQLVNVLTGQMSLVGPRPALPWEVRLFSDRDRSRAKVRPGLSGLWQVSGRNVLSSRQMLELDLEYVRTWSIWRDLAILVRTPMVMLRGDGAR